MIVIYKSTIARYMYQGDDLIVAIIEPPETKNNYVYFCFFLCYRFIYWKKILASHVSKFDIYKRSIVRFE